MTANIFTALRRDESGKGAVRLVFSCCLIAFAVAASSPAFEANPILGETVGEMRAQLPKTLDTIRRAMGG